MSVGKRRALQQPTQQNVTPKRAKTPENLPIESLLFRDPEFLHLTNLIESSTLRCPLYVTGTIGCGKTFLLNEIRRQSDHIPFAFVDCDTSPSEADVVRRIISELEPFYGIDQEEELDEIPSAKAPSTVADVRKFLSTQLDDDEPLRSVIVLDGIEQLTKGVELLTKLILLLHVGTIRLTLVLTGRMPWRNFAFGHPGLGDVVEFHLPCFSKKELIELLLLTFDVPVTKDKDLIALEALEALEAAYCRLIVDTFYPVTKDVGLLRSLAHKHLPTFIRPIRDGKLQPQQTDGLFRAFLPILAAEVHGKPTSLPNEKKSALPVTAPVHLRYVLIAAFLCSYNPSQADARMVAKRHDRVKKANQTPTKKAKDKRLTVHGPQAFSFERLCSNFLSLTADLDVKVCMFQLQAHVKTLCDVRLLARIGHEESLDHPKFKCVCEKSAVQRVAASLDLDLNRYLIDLV
ncbi:putative Origin recognition complex subunit 5 [Hypsibius exemplaris]|uniref:Origin recognition complex subunit 5 n=1 Tax=Hypsibius exemplaris TaxID=2072580 RepID=A0A1W0XAU1_HYPEX|nr:putative Origin recognition complex subunit 5 [Hypsibius exemplaris]